MTPMAELGTLDPLIISNKKIYTTSTFNEYKKVIENIMHKMIEINPNNTHFSLNDYFINTYSNPEFDFRLVGLMELSQNQIKYDAEKFLRRYSFKDKTDQEYKEIIKKFTEYTGDHERRFFRNELKKEFNLNIKEINTDSEAYKLIIKLHDYYLNLKKILDYMSNLTGWNFSLIETINESYLLVYDPNYYSINNI